MLTNETKENGKSMKVVLPWLDRWACRACTGDFCSSLAAIIGPVPVQNIFFITFQFICPHRPARWAGSHAGSPVS
jgi:hypothetical protein